MTHKSSQFRPLFSGAIGLTLVFVFILFLALIIKEEQSLTPRDKEVHFAADDPTANLVPVAPSDELELRYAIEGIVAEVYVQEGDAVREGDILAKLETTNVTAEVGIAEARVASAEAHLATLVEGTRPEKIEIAQKEVVHREALLTAAQSDYEIAASKEELAQEALVSLEQELETAIGGYINLANGLVIKELTTAMIAFKATDDVFEDDAVEDIIQQDVPPEFMVFRQQQKEIEQEAREYYFGRRNLDTLQHAMNAFAFVQDLLIRTEQSLVEAYVILLSLEKTQNYTNEAREQHKNTIERQKNRVDNALVILDTLIKKVEDDIASYQTRIASKKEGVTQAQRDRQNALSHVSVEEAALAVSQAEPALFEAGTRPTEIESFAAEVEREKAALDRIRSRYNDALLVAPTSGTIQAVLLQPGEFSPGKYSESGPAIILSPR